MWLCVQKDFDKLQIFVDWTRNQISSKYVHERNKDIFKTIAMIRRFVNIFARVAEFVALALFCLKASSPQQNLNFFSYEVDLSFQSLGPRYCSLFSSLQYQRENKVRVCFKWQLQNNCYY